jgi:Fe2+ transport system protein FeoA
MTQTVATQPLSEQRPSEPGVPLTALRAGETAIVRCRLLEGQDCELLAAMGLRDRCVLRICRAGEPCIVQVAATRLALSSAVALKVIVVPADRANGGPGAGPLP